MVYGWDNRSRLWLAVRDPTC